MSAPRPCGERQAVWLCFSSCLPKQVFLPCGFCLASLQLMLSSLVPCSLDQTLHQTQSCRICAAHVASMRFMPLWRFPAGFWSWFCWFDDMCSFENHKWAAWLCGWLQTGDPIWIQSGNLIQTGTKVLVPLWDWQTQRYRSYVLDYLLNMILEEGRAIYKVPPSSVICCVCILSTRYLKHDAW